MHMRCSTSIRSGLLPYTGQHDDMSRHYQAGNVDLTWTPFQRLAALFKEGDYTKNPNRLHQALLVLTPLTEGVRSGANTTGKRLSSFVGRSERDVIQEDGTLQGHDDKLLPIGLTTNSSLTPYSSGVPITGSTWI